MPQAVAVIGAGQTVHRQSRPDVNVPELVAEAVSALFAATGLGPADLDALVIGNMEHFEGINYSDLWAAEGTGMRGKPVMKVATGGCTGTSVCAAAYYHCASGLFDLVLAVGWEKLSEGDTTGGIVTAFDPVWERPAFAGAVGHFAMETAYYQQRYSVPAEVFAQASVLAHEHATRNPFAHRRGPLTAQAVLASPLISDPLHLLEMCPTSDGACAVLFASARRARDLCRQPAWVEVFTSKHNHPFIGDIDFEDSTLLHATREAYRLAGIRRPFDEIDVVEMYDPASVCWLSWLELAGLAPRGKARDLLEGGELTFGGRLPFSPSGGVVCTNPIGATGAVRVAEGALQVMGEAGARQVDGVRRALVTGFGGSVWNEVFLLNRSQP